MLKSRQILFVLMAVVSAGFVWGVVHLFQLRFSAGDVYPAYSSLRTDPLGAKALYESLQHIPNLAVNRSFESSSKLEGGKDRVLFIVGASHQAVETMSRSDYEALQGYLVAGGRVVISLLPMAGGEPTNAPENPFLPKPRKSTGKNKAPSRRSVTNSDDSISDSVSFLKTNGLTLKYQSLLVDDTDMSAPELAQAADQSAKLPPLISWHSSGYFDGLSNKWRTIYRRKNFPVLIERSFGAGSLVLSTDSYFVSNEALRKERHAELLAWLVGNRRDIMFDETHLGVREQPGIASLMRRYNLEGVIIGLLLVAGLFVWKNSVSLVPSPDDEELVTKGRFVLGKESRAGFASLLRRSVPSHEILFACFEEWKTAMARDPRVAGRLPEIKNIIDAEKSLPPGARRPLEAYQSINRIVAKRNL